jgi:hypothetical protein
LRPLTGRHHEGPRGLAELSVVVTVVEGGEALTRCLDALSTQSGFPDLEVIVPFDDAVPEVSRLSTRFPFVRFVDAGGTLREASRNAFHEHALYERRRAAGLRAASGRLAALLEDRGCPRADWASTVIALHRGTDAAAIGGVVEHGGRGALRWALFFSDFGRYQPGVGEGHAEYLSDVNICYKREPLDRVRHLWQESYQESTVNWALRRAGHELRLSHAPVVVETRAEARLWPVMRERMHWARIFGHVRGREAASRLSCLLWAAVTPVLPHVLFVRHLRRQLALRHHVKEFVLASPATLLLLHCWSLGECIGYLEAAARPRSPGTREGIGWQQDASDDN